MSSRDELRRRWRGDVVVLLTLLGCVAAIAAIGYAADVLLKVAP